MYMKRVASDWLSDVLLPRRRSVSDCGGCTE